MTTGAQIFLVSACTSGQEFVAAFRRYADRNGVFIPIAEPLPVGHRARFALTLSDGGVMVEGQGEVVSSAKTPSVLHGRIGMTIRFLEPDEPSTTTLAELLKARLAMKPPAPSVMPRYTALPSDARPVPPAPSGRVDAASALAECVAMGDVPMTTTQKIGVPATSTPRTKPPTQPPMPSGGSARTKPPTRPPTRTRPVAVVAGDPGMSSVKDVEVATSEVADTIDVAATLRDPRPEQDQTMHGRGSGRAPASVRTATPSTPMPASQRPAAPVTSTADIESAEPTELSSIPHTVDRFSTRERSSGHLREQRTTVLGVPIVPGGVPVLPATPRDRSGGISINPADTIPGAQGAPSGNWAILPDPSSPDGWSEPAKLDTPPEVERVAKRAPAVMSSEEPLDSDSGAREPVIRASEPNVQVDPVLSNRLPKSPDDLFETAAGNTTGPTAMLPMTPMAVVGASPQPPDSIENDPALSPTFPNMRAERPLPGVGPMRPSEPAFSSAQAMFQYPVAARPRPNDPPTIRINHPPSRRKLWLIGGAAAAALLIGGTVWMLSGDDAKTAASAVEPKKKDKSAPTHGPARSSAADSPAETKPKSHAKPDDKPSSGSKCQVQVASTPKGAEVSLDEASLGTTPATLTLPCDVPAKLVIRKARYAPISRTVTPKADPGKPVRVVLQRVIFAVKVSSTPPGATIRLGRKMLGITPTSIKLPGFEIATIKIGKEGYVAETEKITPKQNNQAVQITLKKAPKKK